MISIDEYIWSVSSRSGLILATGIWRDQTWEWGRRICPAPPPHYNPNTHMPFFHSLPAWTCWVVSIITDGYLRVVFPTCFSKWADYLGNLGGLDVSTLSVTVTWVKAPAEAGWLFLPRARRFWGWSRLKIMGARYLSEFYGKYLEGKGLEEGNWPSHLVRC